MPRTRQRYTRCLALSTGAHMCGSLPSRIPEAGRGNFVYSGWQTRRWHEQRHGRRGSRSLVCCSVRDMMRGSARRASDERIQTHCGGLICDCRLCVGRMGPQCPRRLGGRSATSGFCPPQLAHPSAKNGTQRGALHLRMLVLLFQSTTRPDHFQSVLPPSLVSMIYSLCACVGGERAHSAESHRVLTEALTAAPTWALRHGGEVPDRIEISVAPRLALPSGVADVLFDDVVQASCRDQAVASVYHLSSHSRPTRPVGSSMGRPTPRLVLSMHSSSCRYHWGLRVQELMAVGSASFRVCARARRV